MQRPMYSKPQRLSVERSAMLVTDAVIGDFGQVSTEQRLAWLEGGLFALWILRRAGAQVVLTDDSDLRTFVPEGGGMVPGTEGGMYRATAADLRAFVDEVALEVSIALRVERLWCCAGCGYLELYAGQKHGPQ